MSLTLFPPWSPRRGLGFKIIFHRPLGASPTGPSGLDDLYKCPDQSPSPKVDGSTRNTARWHRSSNLSAGRSIRRFRAAATVCDFRSPTKTFLDDPAVSDRVPGTSRLRTANGRQRIASTGRQESQTSNGRAGHHFDKEPHIFLSNPAQACATLAPIAAHVGNAARGRHADCLIMGHDARCVQPAKRRARRLQPPCWHHHDKVLLRQALCAW